MKTLVLALLVAASAAQAQYKCGTTYQQLPCADGTGKQLPAPPAADTSRETRVANAIAQGKVAIGMTAAEAERAWGKPDAINRTATATSTSEQWVYRAGRRTQYVYLVDGVVKTIQSPG